MLRRCFALLLLIFIPLSGCQSFIELAKAMNEEEEASSRSRPRRSRNNNAESKAKIPDDGFFRLILNEKTGSFSLFFLSEPEKMRYESLFNSDDPSASYMTAYVDGNVYQLGSSRQFKSRFERIEGSPAVIHESSFLTVTQIFKPVKTTSSAVANGVMVSLIIENTATQRSSVGLRMLLDTDLGEGRRQVPFITNTQVVSSELLLEGNSNERFWVSRGKNTALMGSIISPVDSKERGPDLVHLANWKRLNDSPWRLRYREGRSFNNVPNSVRDSAVCYFFGPVMIDRNTQTAYTIYLTTEDIAWYNMNAPLASGSATLMQVPPPPAPSPIPVPAIPAPEPLKTAVVVPEPVYIDNATIDLALVEAEAIAEAEHYYRAGIHEDAYVLFLIKLQDILDQFVNGQIIINEQDIKNIEGAIERLRVRN